MQLDIVRKAAMVAVVPALLALILVTPALMGHPTVLSAIPAVIIGLTESRVVLDLHGAVDHYLYKSIVLVVQGQDNTSFRREAGDYETYDLQVNFSRNVASAFDVFVLIADRQGNTFALNGTVFQGSDTIGDFASMTDRDSFRTVLIRPPADLRALIPRSAG